MRALDIQLRAGPHTGECELIGEDIGGMAVNIGARISGVAEPARFWCPGRSRTSSSDRASRSRTAVPRQLKGVPGEWHLYGVEQVEAPASNQLVPETRERSFAFTDS